MARVCVYCEKKPVSGNKISHSNIKTKVRHFPNLQKVRVVLGGLTQRAYVCTRCLRSGKASKPYNQPRPVAAVQATAEAAS